MDEKKSIKVSMGIVMCVIMILVLIAALGVVYYMGFVKNKEEILTLKDEVNTLKSKNSISERIEKNDTVKTNNLASKDISVVDAVNYSDGYYQLFKVKLPKIVGNTETINELNAKILNEVLPKTYSDVAAHTEIKSAMNKGSMYDYRYIIKNNILTIYIYSSVPEGGSGIPATNNGLESCIYCYDIENDKVLTIEETAKKLNLNVNEYLEGIPDYYSIYKQLDKDTPIVKVDSSRL